MVHTFGTTLVHKLCVVVRSIAFSCVFAWYTKINSLSHVYETITY